MRQFRGQGACLSQVVSERQLFGNFDPLAVWQFPAPLKTFAILSASVCKWRFLPIREPEEMTPFETFACDDMKVRNWGAIQTLAPVACSALARRRPSLGFVGMSRNAKRMSCKEEPNDQGLTFPIEPRLSSRWASHGCVCVCVSSLWA
jgi:hypothetical protein